MYIQSVQELFRVPIYTSVIFTSEFMNLNIWCSADWRIWRW